MGRIGGAGGGSFFRFKTWVLRVFAYLVVARLMSWEFIYVRIFCACIMILFGSL